MKGKVLNIFDFLKEIEKLHFEKRTNTLSNEEEESVSHHCFSMAILVILLKNHIKGKFDYERVLEMAIVHDLAEIGAGDMPLYKQDMKGKIEKKKSEESAIKDLLKKLPKDISDNIESIWREYEARSTKEARLTKLIDLFDAGIKNAIHPNISYMSQYGDGQFYYDYYANWNPIEKLKINGEVFKVMEREIYKSILSKMDEKNIKYNVKKQSEWK